MSSGFCRKFNYVQVVVLGLLVVSGSVSAQPFLNSLAVLFRARPPWPTTFPVGGQQQQQQVNGNNGQGNSVNSNFGFPTTNSISQASVLGSGTNQQGILVAHPLPNHASNSNKKFIPPALPKFPIHLHSATPFFPGNQPGKDKQKSQPQPVLHTSQTLLQPVRQNLKPQPQTIVAQNQNLQQQAQTIVAQNQNLQPQAQTIVAQNQNLQQQAQTIVALNQNLQPQLAQNLQPHPQPQPQSVVQNIQQQTTVQNVKPQPFFQNIQNSQSAFQPQPQISQQQAQVNQPQLQQSTYQQQQAQNPDQPTLIHSYAYEEVTHHDLPNSFDESLLAQLDQVNSFDHESAATSGSFAFPDPPSPPQFQSMSSNSVEVVPNYVTASSNTKPQWQHSSAKNIKNLENHSSVHRLKGVLKESSREQLSLSTGSRSREKIRQSSREQLSRPKEKLRQSSREQLSTNKQHSEPISSNSHYTKAGQNGEKKSLAFRPSPQLHTGPSGSSGFGGYSSNEIRNGDRQEKKVSSFQPTEAKDAPRFESGFQPISYHQYASGFGTTATREQYTNSHTQYYNPWSASQYAPATSVTTSTTTTTKPPASVSTYRQDRKIINGAVSRSVVTTDASIEESRSSESSEVFGGVTTTSSSELVEDWVRPHAKPQPNPPQRFPVYKKKTVPVHDGKPLRIRPVKCDRYHRFGFCPVTSHYPLAQVEKIASRCSALLSHLIAPLPKTDVHYDIVVTRNESSKGRAKKRAGSRGWSWKNFRGKPLCNTEELKILPAYAKDEDGQWLIILQTQIWKQEAQVSICSLAHGAQSSCRGLLCNKDMRMSLKTKCVQRFTAQRLAVLDPDNQDRCPIIKSVFLPSACVCLSDEGTSAESPSSASASRENRETSSSNQVQVILPHTQGPLMNGTFMIVTKKFSTNESSTESQVDLPA